MLPLRTCIFRSRTGALVLLIAALVLTATVGRASLTWQNTEHEFATAPGDQIAIGLFRFTNPGKAPVTIISLDTSCGCTTAELAKRTYAPGESGEIKAIFNLGERTGLQEKSVQVTTDENPSAPTTLKLKVTIPDLFTCTPRLQLWRVGDSPSAKTTLVTAVGPLKITGLEPYPAMPDQATTRIECLEAGTRYRLTLEPASLAKATSIPLTFQISFANHPARVFTLYLLVK